MSEQTMGFIPFLGVFLIQLALSYFITAACIDGLFPRRDVLMFPIVMLTIAAVLTYLLREFAVMEPMFEHLRSIASLYSTCTGSLLGICAASLVHRAALIRLAMESRNDNSWSI